MSWYPPAATQVMRGHRAMKVYKQNVDDVLIELNRTVDDMETLAKMYPLTEQISLQEAIGYAHSAQDILTGLRRATPSAAAEPKNDLSRAGPEEIKAGFRIFGRGGGAAEGYLM